MGINTKPRSGPGPYTMPLPLVTLKAVKRMDFFKEKVRV